MPDKIYSAYGLVFQSEWEIPELLEGSGQPDVNLRLVEVPEQLEEFSDDQIASFYQKTRQAVHSRYNLENLVKNRTAGSDQVQGETSLRKVC